MQATCVVGAIALTGIYLAAGNRPVATVPDAMPKTAVNAVMPLLSAAVPEQGSAGAETVLAGPGLVTGSVSGSLMARAEIADYAIGPKLAALSYHDVAQPAPAPRGASGDTSNDVFDPARVPQEFRYLIHSDWSEVPPAEKPAEVVLRSLKDIPVGTPVEEI